MTFSVKWHPKALKILEGLPKETIRRVLDKIDSASSDPWDTLNTSRANSINSGLATIGRYWISIGNRGSFWLKCSTIGAGFTSDNEQTF